MSRETKVTWEIKSEHYGKWIRETQVVGQWPQPVFVSEGAMIEDILSRTEEKGFFKDIVAWLERDAPRMMRESLRELYVSRPEPVSYERLCEFVYNVGLRASGAIERRMLLEGANKWAEKYFGDFPPTFP